MEADGASSEDLEAEVGLNRPKYRQVHIAHCTLHSCPDFDEKWRILQVETTGKLLSHHDPLPVSIFFQASSLNISRMHCQCSILILEPDHLESDTR